MKRSNFTILFLFVFAFISSIQAAVVPHQTEVNNDAPIFFYRFGETSGAAVNDDSANNQDAAFNVGGFTRNVNTLLFNQGTTDKSVAVANATLSGAVGSFSTTTGFSASLLVNFTTVETGAPHRFLEVGFQGSSGFGWHYLRYDPTVDQIRLGYNFANGTTAANVEATWLPVAGQTYHLSVTQVYATGVTKFFVNGYKIAEVTGATNITPLANHRPTMLVDVNATVDEMAFFGTGLIETRVKAQFASSRAADLATNIYYASPTGSIYGRGTTTDPLNGQTLFNFGLLQAGGIGYFKTGEYAGIFTSKVYGTSASPIVFRSAIGEKATFNGYGLMGDVISLLGDYTDITRFIIRKQYAIRWTTLQDNPDNPIINPATGQSTKGVGVGDFGNRNRVYYNVIHDVMGDGINSFTQATNSVYYANLIFNNGWYAPRSNDDTADQLIKSNGHGIYTFNNQAAGRKYVNNNLFINPFVYAHKHAGTDAASVQNFEVKNSLQTWGAAVFNGGSSGLTSVNVDNLISYKSAVQIFYQDGIGSNNSLTNSYLLSGEGNNIELTNFTGMTMTGNTVMADLASSSAHRFDLKKKLGTTYTGTNTINNNTYYIDKPNVFSDFLYTSDDGTTRTAQSKNFADYKSLTGWDAASTQITNGTAKTRPTVNKTFVQVSNQFENGFGYVAVFNWENFTTQTINITSILTGLPTGTTYAIHLATNYFGGAAANGAIATGVWNGTSASFAFPLKTIVQGGTLPSVAQPYGEIKTGSFSNPQTYVAPETAPEFAAFIVQPVAGGTSGTGGTLTTINHFFNTP